MSSGRRRRLTADRQRGEGSGHIPLKLVDSTTFSTGVLSLTYARG
ncbi:MAG: hypothetical protein QOH36_1555 [Actinomycetota bacterium]|jgi:hypothetical protein|nr:hypothetical protein [Actinomycetota bacterium]